MILFANCGEVGAVARVVKFLWLCVKLVLLREKGKVSEKFEIVGPIEVPTGTQC